MSLKAIEKRGLPTVIAERLTSYILSGPFRPGDKLPPERDLAHALKVTRTTIREALKILETLRLVAIRQGDGVRVQDYLKVANLEVLADLLFRNNSLDTNLLDNILEARLLFGRVLVRLAVQRAQANHIEAYQRSVERLKQSKDDLSLQEADLDCIDTLANASGNLVFVFVLNSIKPIYMRYREVFKDLYRDRESIIEGHETILQALKEKDPDKAEKGINLAMSYSKEGYLYGKRIGE